MNEPVRLGVRGLDVGLLLRESTHGHTRQLSAAPCGHLLALTQRTCVLAGIDTLALADVDSMLRGRQARQAGSVVRHTKIAKRQVLRKGLSPLVTAISTGTTATVIAGIRLRAGKAGSREGRGQHGHRSGDLRSADRSHVR